MTTQNTPKNSMADKAVLATLKITQWSARRHDKSVSAEVAAQKGATKKAGKYHKALINAESLEDVNSAASDARAALNSLTLPWASEGVRILPAAAFDRFESNMDRCAARFDSAVAAFLADYPERVEQARRNLGELFDATDYPSPKDLANAFKMERRIFPFPESSDFRVEISDSQRDRIRAEIADEQRHTLQNAARDLWDRVYKPVAHMAEKLAAYEKTDDGKTKGVFRDTLVSNVADIAELLPALNLTADPRLDEMASRIKSRLANATAQQLRENDGLRVQVAADAQEMAETMAGWLDGAEGSA